MPFDKSYMGPPLPAVLQSLITLALDLRWSWSHSMDSLWNAVDTELWQATGNPWLLLETVSTSRLQQLAGDAAFVAELRRHVAAREEALSAPSWCAGCIDASELGTIAYFSMEFGLSEALPLYSGGLGILAGDYLKTASDLGVPVIGVGLLFQRGYFRQSLDNQGRQIALFPYNDPVSLPLMPLRDASGEWVRIPLPLPGRELTLRCWDVVVGRNHLYLLDSNDPVNLPQDRGITGELYGGTAETRLQQELVLGVGGWRLLDALAGDIRICHLNEGHAAFVTLARAATLMKELNLNFEEALTAARSGTLFTTHTPVAASFDRFPLALIRQYLQPLASQWHIPIGRILELGAEPAAASADDFNMTNFAVRTAGAINGVSESHESISKQLFTPLFPRWPLDELPVGHITNGVHMSSWDSPAADRLWTQACGKERWRGGHEELEEHLCAASDAQLWECRCANRKHLIDDLTVRQRRQSARHGEPASNTYSARSLLDPNALLIGFARRFTGYKRTNLLLQSQDRLIRLLNNTARPVQLVFAGKADPRDAEGLAMIAEWMQFLRNPALRPGRAVFVEDYDMGVAASLTTGVDLWINTPRRPWEACGTSGMKILVNGGLNVSVLDGWWAEAYSPELGWAIGDVQTPETGADWDRRDADSLFALLENEIIPEFFERDVSGVPRKWVHRMRESMAHLTPLFSGNRMLREYLESYYLPLARRYQSRVENNAVRARNLSLWQQRLLRHLADARIEGPVWTPAADGWQVSALAYLDGLNVDDVRIELYAEAAATAGTAEIVEMQVADTLTGAVQGFRYQTAIHTNRPQSDYSLRVRPQHADANIPLECPAIRWI